jgi:hypothetical protein
MQLAGLTLTQQTFKNSWDRRVNAQKVRNFVENFK